MSTHEKLRAAGARLANCAYNLATCARLNGDERRSLDEARRDWDAAIAAQTSPVVKQNLTTQPAAAQEAVGFQIRIRQWSSDPFEGPWLHPNVPNRKHYDSRPGNYETRSIYAAPVTAAPADLIERCREILAWQRTGVLPGDALRAYANARWPDEHDPLQIAEKETAREAFRILSMAAAVSTPAAPGIDLAALRARVVSAVERITSGAASMRIPADMTDPDLVLGDVLCLLDSLGPQTDASAKGVTFRNYGDSEAQFIADGERLNCPACGGSGHVEDSPKGGSEARDAVLAELVEAISAFKGKRGAFMALGAQDERTVRLWWALANAQAGDAEVEHG